MAAPVPLPALRLREFKISTDYDVLVYTISVYLGDSSENMIGYNFVIDKKIPAQIPLDVQMTMRDLPPNECKKIQDNYNCQQWNQEVQSFLNTIFAQHRYTHNMDVASLELGVVLRGALELVKTYL